MAAAYLKIKNWEKYQHYKDRNAPWIKLYTDIFHDYEFSCLQDASKLLAFCIMTLAGTKKEGVVPYDFGWIKRQGNLGDMVQECHLIELINNGFVYDASKMLASCKQVARPETETETEIVVSNNKQQTTNGFKIYNKEVIEDENVRAIMAAASQELMEDCPEQSIDFENIYKGFCCLLSRPKLNLLDQEFILYIIDKYEIKQTLGVIQDEILSYEQREGMDKRPNSLHYFNNVLANYFKMPRDGFKKWRIERALSI